VLLRRRERALYILPLVSVDVFGMHSQSRGHLAAAATSMGVAGDAAAASTQTM
jgi:hypothetical protein